MSTTAIPTSNNTPVPAPVVTAEPIATTPEEVATYLMTLAEYAHARIFAVEHGRLPRPHEAKFQLVECLDRAYRAYMLRDDVDLNRRLDIAAQVMARHVARVIQRAQAQDSLS